MSKRKAETLKAALLAAGRRLTRTQRRTTGSLTPCTGTFRWRDQRKGRRDREAPPFHFPANEDLLRQLRDPQPDAAAQRRRHAAALEILGHGLAVGGHQLRHPPVPSGADAGWIVAFDPRKSFLSTGSSARGVSLTGLAAVFAAAAIFFTAVFGFCNCP